MPSSLRELISLRLMTDDDRRFVASSWFESFWKNSERHRGIAFSVYRPHMDTRINRLLDAGETLIVHAAHIPDEILGYVVFDVDREAIHWCYVKSAYRGEGIATALCKGRGKWYTHAAGDAGTRLARTLGFEFNPYLSER
jgi:hypothetical protein